MLNRYGIAATRAYLLAGHAMTRLEAMVFFGTPDLTKVISDLRREGKSVRRRTITLSHALRRLNETATLVPPAALPVKDISVTEYWVEQ
ncbi:hypothetical protein M8312_13370 [Sphingomonas sp. KRR8]|uniref:hypothetical protein n=1 Tax=Sphingomonas sp. KRR8 TaxID=2942996 RepID=UPI002021F6F1|nr:hypothetical protein [Sphingomonas sp. KRR8]URD60748.1 hypothetical protein M8312_13370 [Sphingomonas sp. KRR8]